MKKQRFTVLWMGKAQALGMQQQAWSQRLHTRWGIQSITHQGVPQVGQVHAQLVAAPSYGLQPQPGTRARHARLVGGHAIAGGAGFAGQGVDHLPGALLPIAAQRGIHLLPALGVQCARRDGAVALVHLALGKGLA